MLSYTWYLAAEQPVQPHSFAAIQYILASYSAFLDVIIEGDKASLTVFVPEQLNPSSSGGLPGCLDGPGATGGSPPAPAPHGRPVKPPTNDITLEQVYKMQSEGTRADDIAAFMGVSRPLSTGSFMRRNSPGQIRQSLTADGIREPAVSPRAGKCPLL